MKTKYIISLIIFLLIIGAGFYFYLLDSKIPESKQQIKPTVAATIFPIYDITRTIAGDAVDVQLIVEPGASPHTFEASPKQLRALSDVAYIFAIGHGIDDWIAPLAENVGAQIITVDKHIDLKQFGEEAHIDHEDLEDEHTHGKFDPHYWLDPNNAILIAQQITEELSLQYPQDKSLFEENLANFRRDIANADKKWKTEIQTLKDPKIMTFHDAFGYFADHFGITIAATFEPFPGKKPTARYLAELEQTIEAQHIQAIFLEPQLSTDAIASFAKDAGIGLGVLDPLGGEAERSTYIDLISYNIEHIVHAFK